MLGPRPVLLVGWSLGVLDALAYVHTHGDAALAGLVLVDNSVGEEPAPVPRRPASGAAGATAALYGTVRARHVPHAAEPVMAGAR